MLTFDNMRVLHGRPIYMTALKALAALSDSVLIGIKCIRNGVFKNQQQKNWKSIFGRRFCNKAVCRVEIVSKHQSKLFCIVIETENNVKTFEVVQSTNHVGDFQHKQQKIKLRKGGKYCLLLSTKVCFASHFPLQWTDVNLLLLIIYVLFMVKASLKITMKPGYEADSLKQKLTKS